MENASKALIIAGAILLSILIIGLGMFIYSQASNAMKGTGLESQQATAYNGQFLQYANGKITGTQARQLCNDIIAHNNTARYVSEGIAAVTSISKNTPTVSSNVNTTALATLNTNVQTLRNAIQVGKMYEVTFGYAASTGYIVGFGFKEV